MLTLEQRYEPAKRRKEKAKIAARARRNQESEIFLEMANELCISNEQMQRIDKASIVRLAISYIKAIKALEELSRLYRQLPNTIVPSLCNSTQTINATSTTNNNSSHKLQTASSNKLTNNTTPATTTKSLMQRQATSLSSSQHSTLSSYTSLSSTSCNNSNNNNNNNNSSNVSKGSENQPPIKNHTKSLATTAAATTVLMAKQNNSNTKTLSSNLTNATTTTTKTLTTAAPLNNAPASLSDHHHHYHHHHHHHDNNATATTEHEPVFISHHSADLKFIYIDENVKSFVEFEPESLLGKSLLQFIHVFDTQQLYGSYKALLAKDHTKTEYYRFIAKRGGFVWLLTEASIINRDDYGKPKIIACVNHVMSGIKDKNIIISSKQVAALPPNTQQQLSPSPTPSPSPSPSPKTTTTTTINNNNIKDRRQQQQQQQPIVADIPATGVVNPATTQPKVTDLFPHSVPHLNTYKIFAPKTEDMNSCFLMINDEDGAAILLPDTEVEQEDLTHLAPQAGDVSVPLDVEPLDGIILDQNSPFLEEPTKVPIIDSLDIFIDGSIADETEQLQQQQHHHHQHHHRHHNQQQQQQIHLQHHQQQQSHIQPHLQQHHHNHQHSLSLQQSCDKQDYLIYDYASCLGISPSPPPLEAMSSSIGILDNDSDPVIMNGIMNSNINHNNNNINNKKSWGDHRNQQVNDSFLSDEDLQACMMSTPFSNDIGLDFDPIEDEEDDILNQDKSQQQPDQQINTFRHSVLLNLLVDGSDIAAGYTSKNSRAVTMKHVCSSMH